MIGQKLCPAGPVPIFVDQNQQPRQTPFSFRASSLSLLAVSAASLLHSGESTVGVVALLYGAPGAISDRAVRCVTDIGSERLCWPPIPSSFADACWTSGSTLTFPSLFLQ